MIRAEDWEAGCFKLFNARSGALGITAGEKRFELSNGRAFDFHAHAWKDPFPTKIFKLKPATKLVFSSTWRVTAGRRGLCFIGDANGAVTVRSLLELDFSQPEQAP